jgi:hypothetical protein
VTPLLDVAIGLGFLFLVFSTIASAIVEWLSAALERRHETMRKGLDVALGPKLAGCLLAHPLVKGLKGSGGAPPSYLAPRSVALALADIARETSGKACGACQETHDDLRKLMGWLSDRPTEELKGASYDGVVASRLEQWFLERMDRTTGVYKRRTQVGTVATAVVLTLAFDVDAGRIARELHANAAMRAALVQRASSETVDQTLQAFAASSNAERLADLPIGWKRHPADAFAGLKEGARTAVGWLIAIVAIGFGAPFWFDALSRLASLRLAGPDPSKPRMVAH